MRRNRFLHLITTAGVAFSTSALVIAAPTQPMMMLAASANNVEQSKLVHVANPTSTPETISNIQSDQAPQIWNLKNADIRAVIQTMSILTGKTFIVSPQVKGRVTLISHKPMSVDEMYQVFLSMLRMMNYSAIESSTGVIKVVMAEQANMYSRQIASDSNPGIGAEIVVRVVPLNNVSASELVPVVRPLMSQAASVTAYMPSNALIIAGTAANISRIVKLVHQMDESNINQIRVIHVRYANASKVVSVIKQLQSGAVSQGRVSNMALAADENGNNILVSANAANQLLVKHLVDELDHKGTGDAGTRVIKLNYLTAKKIAPILTKVVQGQSASGGSKGTGDQQNVITALGGDQVSIQAEDNNNALIIHGPAAAMNSILRVVKQLDSRPREVLVEAIIVKVSENLLNKLGIVWGAVNSEGEVVGSGSTASSTQSNALSTPPNNNFTFQINGKGVGFLPTGNLGMLLHLLKTNGSSDVLSTPSIVVLNNQKATIDDGQNVGLANRTYQGANTPSSGVQEVTPFNTIQRTNVTLSLAVTPHISPNRMIRMDLLQKDDSLANDTSSDSDNPTINTSSIKTSVLVRSGDILVLGGLISNEQQKNTQKLPILGDIPLLGHLFRYDTHTMQKSSLMVFIRPIVMDNHSATKQTRTRYRYIRQEQFNVEANKSNGRSIPVLPKLSHHGDLYLQPPIVTLPQPVGLQPYRKPKWKPYHGK